MRYYEKSLIIVSEDNINDPKEIRFKTDSEGSDTTALTKNIDRSDDYATGSHTINMGNITSAKWLYLLPVQDITVKIDGSATPLSLIKDKPLKGWMKFTSLEITTTQETRVTINIAGQ